MSPRGCRGCGASRVVARGFCNACYLMDRKHRLREGTWDVPLVDASPAVEHLQRLAAAGVSKQQMVRLTGLHHTTIYRLQPGTKVHRKTVARILSVEPPLSAHLVVQETAYVHACGTTRRLQALCAMGWPAGQLAARLGLAAQGGYIGELVRGVHDRVQARTARSVEELFDKLQMVVGPSHRVREEAQRRRWAPPLAWDDYDPQHHIDNPVATPTGALYGKVQRVPFVRRYEELRALGYTDDEEIAWRMGITRRSLDRMLSPSYNDRTEEERYELDELHCTPSA